MARFEKAHADWPKTSVTRDGGVHVTGKYVGPRLYANAALYVALPAFILALMLFASTGDLRPAIFAVVAMWAAWHMFLRAAIYAIFGGRLDVKIYADRIALPGLLGYRNYSRDVPVEFRVERHHTALAGNRRRAAAYRNAIEAVMQYGEKRIVLAEMNEKDTEMARALVIRLQNVCHSIDAALEMATDNKTARTVPAGDFGPAPDIR